MKFRVYGTDGIPMDIEAERITAIVEQELDFGRGKRTKHLKEERIALIKFWVRAEQIDLDLPCWSDPKTNHASEEVRIFHANEEYFISLAKQAKMDGIYSTTTYDQDIAYSLIRYGLLIKREKEE